MKKILSYIMVFILFVGILIPTNVALAQQTVNLGNTIDANGNVIINQNSVDSANQVFTRTQSQNAAERSSSSKPAESTCTWGICWNAILGFVGTTIMTVLSLILWISGTLLNWVLKITIVDMASNLKTMTGINVGWKVIRDLMNIAFIFMLVWEGIQMILGSGSAGAKKLITGVIIASVLINFSLFFTKILIDASNIVTIGFYKAMLGDIPAQADKGLSNPIVKSLGLSSFQDPSSISQFVKVAGDSGTKILIFTIGGSLLFLITSFIFLAVSVMFIVRYLTLLLLLITSPIAYMGSALPFMQPYSKQWWNALNSQLLFAPIYMIMTWVTLTLLASPGFVTMTGGSQSYATLFLGTADGKAGTDSIGLLLNFAVVIGLLVATLTTAKSVSSKGSGMIADATNWGTVAAGGVLMGTTAMLGRNAVGRTALRNTSVEELESRAAQGGIAGARAKARLALAKGSYDVRRSGAAETIQKKLGVDFGKGTQGIPFFGNTKAGEGGFAAQKAENKKQNEENIDRISKPFIAKRDWGGLAKALKNKPGMSPFVTDNDWSAQQQSLYKKLSSKERISLENELRNTEKSGFSEDSAKSLINSMRSKLPFDDQIKIFTDRKDFEGLADFTEFKDLDKKEKRGKEQQNYIYEKMTPRDRIELDNVLSKRAGKATGEITNLSKQMRDQLSKEDLEKTVEVGKKTAKDSFNKDRLTNIEKLVSDKTGTPADYDRLLGESSKFPKKEAHELSTEALKDPQVIERLSPGHLNDIMTNHDEFDVVKADILKIINSTIEIPGIKSPSKTTMYKLQKAQQKWIVSNKGIEAQWGIE